jgi:hypothetical protein
MSGSNTVNQPGTYGTKGVAAPGNVPGARSGAVTWSDAAGNLWLFGGGSSIPADAAGFNDLWRYSAGEWTWVGGPSTPGQPGIYGTQGTAAPDNIPGARAGAVSWKDPQGTSGSLEATGWMPMGTAII